MRKKTLWKDIRKCFSKSKGRFFSIVCLVALGSFALVGLQVTGPDMRMTGKQYFNELHTADISIIGTYGIDSENQSAINKASGIEAIDYGYLKDVVVKDTNKSMRIFSATKGISDYEIVQGRMPHSETEIAVASFLSNEYNLHDTISFTEKEDVAGNSILKYHTFQIVGFVNSGELLSIINMGQSTAGTGELQGYAVTTKDTFDSEVFMIARLSYQDTKGVDPYSDEYTKFIGKHKNELDKLLVDQPDLRLHTIKSEYQDKINDAQQQLDDAKQELSFALDKLERGQRELVVAKQQYVDGMTDYVNHESDSHQQLNDAKQQLMIADKQISEGAMELDTKSKALISAENIAEDARKTLDVKWYEYHEKQQLFAYLKQMEAELNEAQTALDTNIEIAEVATGMTIAEIETSLPNTKIELNALKTKYEQISGLFMLKEQRDAAIGLPNYETINKQYQEALQAAKVTEAEADVLYAQLDDMDYQISIAQAQYDQLYTLIEQKNKLMEKWKTYYEVALPDDTQAQLTAVKIALDRAEEEFTTKQIELKKARQQLSIGEMVLENARQEYLNGVDLYHQKSLEANTMLSGAEQTLHEAFLAISESDQKLAEGWQEYHQKKPAADEAISVAEVNISDAKITLDNLKPAVYSINTRREIPGAEGYKIYTTVSHIIDSLADIFPVFLYFVAALVTLTTMTRFVDEERINAGTLKALGYDKKDIIKKFAVYGFVASMTGAIIGIILGHTLLPTIAYNAYGGSFTYPQIELHVDPVISIVALLLAFLCAVVPALIVANQELREKPSSLLMPKAPEAGSKILLERIRPIWNKLSFTHKVTARNMFRYKKRMLMTIFGVCGAVTLIFAGFSVQHAISGVKDRQFKDIMKYDLIVAQADGMNKKQKDELDGLMSSDSFQNQISIHYEAVTKIAGENNDKQDIKLIVPKDTQSLTPYITLMERTSGDQLTLSDDGCLISERLAQLLQVQSGDTFTFLDSENNQQRVMISGITEMYTGHFIFMNQSYYEKAFAKQYDPNANLINLKNGSIDNAKKQAYRFMELDGVKGVVQNTTMTNQIDTIVDSLNRVMEILIVVAILLAAVILYNLTSINVAERIRELSTIKVLGFYNQEVTLYIYRETIILTLLGILAGFIVGYGLYLYIITVVPPDDVMFNPALGIKAFMIPTIVVLLITLFLGVMMNRYLKHVDMLEALKSVE